MSSERDSARDPASERGRASLMLPECDEILERQRRLADFQAAWRALTPPVGEADANGGRVVARELHERLEKLDDQMRSEQAWPRDAESADRKAAPICNALERLDGELDRYAELLCSHLEGVPWNRLCAHLPAGDAAQSNGFAALVDFILGAQPDLERHGTLVDHLVTALATGEQGGRRRIVRDPATLTPKLRSISQRAAASSNLDLSKVEREFIEAARRCEEGLADELLREMHARKAELGCAILTPQVLRSVVFYNVTAWNVSSGRAGRGSSGAAPDPGDNGVSEVPAPVAAKGVDSRPRAAGVASKRPTRRDPGCAPNRSADSTRAPDLVGGAPDASEVQWRIERPPIEAPSARTPEPAPRVRRARARLAVTMGSLAAALLLATPAWWSGSQDTVQVLSKVDLQAISTQLDSGYRDRFGSGPLFVGTVGGEWEHLSSAEREQSASQIVSRLCGSGVREILVYDNSRRLALHFAEGLPLRIGL